MAFSYGFFNSHDGDRTYSAKQFGSIFDGIINDGVFRTIGQQFAVSAGGGMSVNVGTGRGWFCHTWVLNTSSYSVSVPQSEVILNRVDVLVLEIDHREDYRRTRLRVIEGPTENLQPSWPPASSVKDWFTFWNTEDQKQIPIAYIRVLGKVTQINADDIFTVVGKVSYGGPPFVTGPLETVDLSVIYSDIQNQWNSFYQGATSQYTTISRQLEQLLVSGNQRVDTLVTQGNQRINQLISQSSGRFNEFMAESKTRFEEQLSIMEDVFKDFIKQHNVWFNDFVDLKNNEFNIKMTEWDTSFSSFWTDFKQGMVDYLTEQENIWENWFNHIQGQLSDDAATNLQRQIDALSFVYILGERAILGITASAIHKRVVFGTFGSVAGERAMISAPSRDVVWMFDEKAILGIIATVIHDVATFSKYAGVTGDRVIISVPTWYPFVPVGPATTDGRITDARFTIQDDTAMFSTTKRNCECIKEGE